MQGPPPDAAGCSWMSSLDFLGAEDLIGSLGAPGDMAFLDSATLAAVCNVGQHQQPHQLAPPAQLGTAAEAALVKRANPDDDCGGDDSDEEDARARSGSNKRSKGDSSADAARTKASKEKARRGKINDRFSELAKLIEPPGSEPKTDKPSILGDAIKFVQQMTVENHQLKQLNKFLEERVAHYERERGQNLYQQSLVIQGMRPQQSSGAQQHPVQMQHQPMQMQAMQQQQPMMQVPAMIQQHQQQQGGGMMQVVHQQGPMMQAAPGHVHMSSLSHTGSEPLEQATSSHSAGQLPPSSGQQQQQQQFQMSQPVGTSQQQQQQQQQQHSLASASSLQDCKPDGMAPNSLPSGPAPSTMTPCPPQYSMLPMHAGPQQYTIVHLPPGPGQHHYYSSDLKVAMSGGQVASMQAPMQSMQPMGLALMGPGAKPPHWVTNMLDSTQDSLLRPPAA